MKKRLFLLTFLVIFKTQIIIADEPCQRTPDESPQTTDLEKLAGKIAIISSKSTQDHQALYQSATTYLTAVGVGIDFNDNEANHFISQLTPLCENAGIEKNLRSKICTRLSGLHAKMAQKLKLSGIENGKSAYKYLKTSLELNPDNLDAVVGHAWAIVGIYDQGFIIRKLAESNLGVSAKEEALIAKKNLERLNYTNQIIYKKLLDVF